MCTDRSFVLRLHIVMLNGMYYGMILNKNVFNHIIDFNNCLTNCKTYCKKKKSVVKLRNEPRCEKTGLRGFRLGPTQARLYNHRWLEA